jgi:hypothetical protein
MTEESFSVPILRAHRLPRRREAAAANRRDRKMDGV